MSKPKTLEALKNQFEEQPADVLLKLAKALDIPVSIEQEMTMGTQFVEVKRGKATEAKTMIRTPDVKVDGKNIVGVNIDPRVLLPTITALIEFARNNKING
jgi:hypothetical protein